MFGESGRNIQNYNWQKSKPFLFEKIFWGQAQGAHVVSCFATGAPMGRHDSGHGDLQRSGFACRKLQGDISEDLQDSVEDAARRTTMHSMAFR